jgi:hypothetical protein
MTKMILPRPDTARRLRGSRSANGGNRDRVGAGFTNRSWSGTRLSSGARLRLGVRPQRSTERCCGPIPQLPGSGGLVTSPHITRLPLSMHRRRGSQIKYSVTQEYSVAQKNANGVGKLTSAAGNWLASSQNQNAINRSCGYAGSATRRSLGRRLGESRTITRISAAAIVLGIPEPLAPWLFISARLDARTELLLKEP